MITAFTAKIFNQITDARYDRWFVEYIVWGAMLMALIADACIVGVGISLAWIMVQVAF